MSIGNRISERRRELGYSQEYVAEKLNVSRQAVSKWEQDLCAPDTYNLIALSELLGLSVEYLAAGRQSANSLHHPNTDTPPAPPPSKGGLGTARLVGLILLSAGLLSLILGLLFSRALIALSTLLLLYGILMLSIRRNLGLVLLWVTVAIVFLLVTMLMPLRSEKIISNADGSATVAVTSLSAIMPLSALIALAGVGICIRIRRNKQKKKQDNQSHS